MPGPPCWPCVSSLLRRDQGEVLHDRPESQGRDERQGTDEDHDADQQGNEQGRVCRERPRSRRQLGDGDRAGELFALLNPINHSSTRAGLYKYRVEPYVAAGDVYAVPPHTGRGGWTWYTGSASWMYRAGLESILGFQLNGDRLRLNPCIPRDWREFEINYRHHKTSYNIRVENPHSVCRGVASLVIDGEIQATPEIQLSNDGQLHRVSLILGTPEI